MDYSSEYLGRYLAVDEPDDEDGDVLTKLPSFASRLRARRSELGNDPEPTNHGRQVPPPQESRNGRLERAVAKKRKSYKEDDTDDESTDRPSSSIKKSRSGSAPGRGIRQSKQSIHDGAEFEPEEE